MVLDTSLKLMSIREVQGEGLSSPLAGKMVRTFGLVTGILHRGFYLQTPNLEWNRIASDAIFVYSPDWFPEPGDALEITGKVVDYLKHDAAKPVTQIKLDQVKPRSRQLKNGDKLTVDAIELTASMLECENGELASLLNSLEGMLVSLSPEHTFIAPSNPFGDYVLLANSIQENTQVLRSEQGGVLLNHDNPLQWYPGFRAYNYNHAPRLNVGAQLRSKIQGPLHYRVDSWQIAIDTPFEIEESFIERTSASLCSTPTSVTVMTLNCFNLDTKIEAFEKVQNPRQDVDDDWGDGRFHTLAQAVVLQAHCPDIIALQEIQDNDGAEQTKEVGADKTYELLIKTIAELSKVEYAWVNIDPRLDADGGQPGGNIRNGFLYNPTRIKLIVDSVTVLGSDHEAFIDSRKPLLAKFQHRSTGGEITCINLHLASKRHQRSIFAPVDPGVDEKLSIRVEQAKLVAKQARELLHEGCEFYITGDFNDTEHSQTLAAMTGDFAQNLVMLLPNYERYDYNHRGKLQVLMHGIVSNSLAAERAEYEIIHGNELIGVTPGESSDKPSDHAYVLARINVQGLR